MMRHTIAAALATAIALVAPAARAAEVLPLSVDEKAVLSGKQKLDPAAGYILVTAPVRLFGTFLRVPDAETMVAWEKDRQAAFVKEHRRWETWMDTWRGEVELAKSNRTKPPEQPVEPKIETFSYSAPDLRDMVQFGPQYTYAKVPVYSYLTKVKPGTYVWYGNVLGGNGLPAGGTCMCMGTVSFEVKPGVITDVGNSLMVLPKWDEDPDVQRMELKQAMDKRIAEGKESRAIDYGALAYGLPASLKDWPSVQPELHASPKINNYFGIMVSRLAPIPGVLAYRRDTVVDARTGQDVVSPTLVSMKKPKL